MSYLVAEEFLLASLSQPRIWKVAIAPTLFVAAILDRLALRSGQDHPNIWPFHLIVAQR
jgi:hypothetical protein